MLIFCVVEIDCCCFGRVGWLVMVVKSCRYSTRLGVPFIVTAGVDRWKVLGSIFSLISGIIKVRNIAILCSLEGRMIDNY